MSRRNQYRYDTTAEQEPTDQHAYPEWGRRWPRQEGAKRLLPIDVIEKDRMDILHKIFTELRGGKLYKVPLSYGPRGGYGPGGRAGVSPSPTTRGSGKSAQSPNGPNILDLGTGTGIWALNMANLWPQGSVLGLDLYWYLQPPNIMPNSHFWPLDLETQWVDVEYNWDMVHIRMLVGQIVNWQGLYNKAFDHLRPGTGWIEHVELDFKFLSYNNSITEDSVFRHWEQCYHNSLSQMGIRSVCDPAQHIAMLEAAGFVDIDVETINVPLSPWDPETAEMGRSANLAVTRGLQAMSLRPMISSGMSKDAVDRLVDALGHELCRLSWKTYIRMYVFTGRRPEGPRIPMPPGY